jgi:outer membrane protein OmpA-like peptidoglycan-associated protein
MATGLVVRARMGAATSLVALLAGAGLAACGGPAEAEPPVGLAIAVSKHANGPAVPVSELQQIIPDRLPGGSHVVIIGIDGSADGVPIYDKSIKKPDDPSAADPLAAEEDAASVSGRLKPKYEAAAADTTEADPYAAIARAALGIRDVVGPKKLVIIDSMLSTAGLVELQHLGLDGAAEDTWGSIANGDNVPNLAGIDVEVRGLGQTSKPQQPLDEARRKSLEGLTRYILTQAHASSVTFSYPAYAEPPAAGLPKVSTVTVTDPEPAPAPAPKAKRCEPYVVPQTRIQFAGDSAEFVDPERAAGVAGDVAKAMRKCPGALLVTGTTSSWGSKDGRKAVSLQRATAFRTVLAKAMKVDEDSIGVRGAGFDFPERVRDRRSDGTLDPGKAAQNRSVRVSVVGD